MEIILVLALVVSLYFNYKLKSQIKQIIKNHLNELNVYENTVNNLKSKISSLEYLEYKTQDCEKECEKVTTKRKRK